MLIWVLFLEFLRPFCSLSLCMHNLFSPKIEFLVALPWLLLVVIQAPKLKYHLNEISESFVSAVFIEMTLLIRSLTNFDKLAVHKNVLLTLWLSLQLLNSYDLTLLVFLSGTALTLTTECLLKHTFPFPLFQTKQLLLLYSPTLSK